MTSVSDKTETLGRITLEQDNKTKITVQTAWER